MGRAKSQTGSLCLSGRGLSLEVCPSDQIKDSLPSDMKIETGEVFVTVTNSVTGWMWVVMELVEEKFAEPLSSGDQKYATKAEAIVSAKVMARDLEVKFDDGDES